MPPIRKHFYYTRYIDRPRLILFLLILLVLLLALLRLVVKQTLDLNDFTYARVTDEESRLKDENTILRAKLDKARALSTVAQEAMDRGMVPGTISFEQGRAVLRSP